MTEEDTVKFNGSNYREWASYMENKLKQKGFWPLILDKPLELEEGQKETDDAYMKAKDKYRLDDLKAKGLIGGAVVYDLQEMLKNCTTSYQAWHKLKGFYENNEVATLEAHEARFHRLKWKKDETMVMFFWKN